MNFRTAPKFEPIVDVDLFFCGCLQAFLLCVHALELKLLVVWFLHCGYQGRQSADVELWLKMRHPPSNYSIQYMHLTAFVFSSFFTPRSPSGFISVSCFSLTQFVRIEVLLILHCQLLLQLQLQLVLHPHQSQLQHHLPRISPVRTPRGEA